MMKRNGTSLVEVMAALMLVGFSIYGILAVVSQTAGLAQGVELTHTAASLAKNRIERIRQLRGDMGYAAVAQAVETDTVVDSNGAADLNGSFTRTTVIDAGYAPNLTKVTVRVKYKRKGVLSPAAIELVTLISPYN